MTTIKRVIACVSFALVALGSGSEVCGAQTLTEMEQRWASGERRQLLPELRLMRPRASGASRARVDFMLAYVLCESNDLAERGEGFSVAQSIGTSPRPPWTTAAAGRIDRLRSWCGRPVVRSRPGPQQSSQVPLVVLKQEWTSMHRNEKVLSLRGVDGLMATELLQRLMNGSVAGRVFLEQPVSAAPIECEEQVVVTTQPEGAVTRTPDEEDGVLCIQGLWRRNGRVIYWSGDATLPDDWEIAGLAELPSDAGQ